MTTKVKVVMLSRLPELRLRPKPSTEEPMPKKRRTRVAYMEFIDDYPIPMLEEVGVMDKLRAGYMKRERAKKIKVTEER